MEINWPVLQSRCLCLVAGERLPAQPLRQRQTSPVLFDGVLADRHTTEDGSEYIRLIFNRGREPAAVLDAEFLFLSGIPHTLLVHIGVGFHHWLMLGLKIFLGGR